MPVETLGVYVPLVRPNYSGQQPSVSISYFHASADSRHILTITCHLSPLNHAAYCRFCIIQLIRYVRYGSTISQVPGDYISFEIG